MDEVKYMKKKNSQNRNHNVILFVLSWKVIAEEEKL